MQGSYRESEIGEPQDETESYRDSEAMETTGGTCRVTETAR